jgi:hypothetical protein
MDSSKHRLPHRIVTDCLALAAPSRAAAPSVAGSHVAQLRLEVAA